MKKGLAIIHAAPVIGAAFTQYMAELEQEGCLADLSTRHERFVYVLDGRIHAQLPDKSHDLSKGDYVYIPPQLTHSITAARACKLAVIEKKYVAVDGVPAPKAFTGKESFVTPEPLKGDGTILVRQLLPDDTAFDCAVNMMMYQPGASLPTVEIHVMEHGLLMIEGGGIYQLGGYWYPVMAGDFIWMGPYCPQWFAALGRVPSSYLIYKDSNRHPLT